MSLKKLAAIALAMTMSLSMLTACGDDDSSSSAPAADNTSSVADDASSADASSEDASSEDASSEDASSEDSSEAPEEPAIEMDAEPVAAEGDIQAFLMCADGSWVFADGNGNWNLVSQGEGLGTDASITGDGTYTVSFNKLQAGATMGGLGIQVLNVDILDLAAKTGCATGAAAVEGTAAAEAEDGAAKKQAAIDAGVIISDVKVLINDEEVVTIPEDKLLYGDIEGNGKIRIEVYNPGGGGDTSKVDGDFYSEEVVDAIGRAEFDKIAVQFTIDIPDDLAAAE